MMVPLPYYLTLMKFVLKFFHKVAQKALQIPKKAGDGVLIIRNLFIRKSQLLRNLVTEKCRNEAHFCIPFLMIDPK